MENPATWGDAEKVIHDALYRAAEAQAAGICGLSTARRIADALRDAELLKEEHDV
jgi:hypothetical protein